MRRFSFVLVAMGVVAACGGSDSGDGDGAPKDNVSRVPPGCPFGPPAEHAYGIKEQCGIFVSSSKGTESGDGTLRKPFASLQKAMEAARAQGKRVFACAQSYREQINLIDHVSAFGYFDCSGEDWKAGDGRAMIDGPASPAVKASGISNGRLDGFEIRSPDATAPSGSSIALFAVSSPGLKIFNSKIHAGKGVPGMDGSDGIQLRAAGNPNGQPGVADEDCCERYEPEGPEGQRCVVVKAGCPERHWVARAGVGGCVGAPGYPGPECGGGGFGGRYRSESRYWSVIEYGTHGWGHAGDTHCARGGYLGTNEHIATGQAGVDGVDGTSGRAFGTIRDDGVYVSSDGTKGTDGRQGQAGGSGGGRETFAPPGPYATARYGSNGSGGGAGGCPGLAGTPATGGGASLAVVAIQSPLQIFTSVIETAGGGNAGKGNTGTAYTPGGEPGAAPPPAFSGARGGNGGRAGVSGSGGGGPSVGVAFKGDPPILTETDVAPGPGGAGVEALTGERRGTVPRALPGVSARTYQF